MVSLTNTPKRTRAVLLASLVAALSAAPVHAAPGTAVNAPGASLAAGQTSGSQSDAKDFVAHMGQQALEFLRNQQLGQAGKENAFRDLLRSSFDMQTIGKFTAGQYWRQMSPQQQQEFQSLFRDYVVGVYSSRFNQYSGQQFQVTGSQQSDSPTDTLVTSTISSAQSQPVEVDWRVRNEDGHNMIVDVLVEGISMSQTQRSDFAAVIQRGGGNPSALIDQLRRQAGGQH